ncbi:MAG TPA: hypothetical protein VF941_00755 [Clostridia bacterium]
MPIMKYADAASIVGIPKTELYNGLCSGKYPGFRSGGNRGKWLVDTDLLMQHIKDLMESNVKKPVDQPIYGTLRKVR